VFSILPGVATVVTGARERDRPRVNAEVEDSSELRAEVRNDVARGVGDVRKSWDEGRAGDTRGRLLGRGTTARGDGGGRGQVLGGLGPAASPGTTQFEAEGVNRAGRREEGGRHTALFKG